MSILMIFTYNAMRCHGADLALCPDDFEQTALIAATLKDEIEVIECLLAKGANINDRNYRNISALMYAADKGKSDIAFYLMQQGAEINFYVCKMKLPVIFTKTTTITY